MMTRPLRSIASLALLSLASGGSIAAVPRLEMEPAAIDQFFSPVAVTHAGDGSGRLFVADQLGAIRVMRDGYVLPQPFLDVSGSLVALGANYDERGLLGLAFHPDFGTPAAPGEGRFYVYYSGPSPSAPGTASDPVNHRSVVAEYRVSTTDPDVADPASERVLLTVEQPQANHNGGQLAFGPLDGMLYISIGDGGSSNDNNAGHTGGSSARPADALGNAQDLTKLLGKVLRIDPLGSNGPGGSYGIPGDNPFLGAGAGIREEIFAYGLRNPWRFSFDDGEGGTNRLFLADVGQGSFEEINLGVSGGNYGWRRFEGKSVFAALTPSVGPYVEPIAEYAHPGRAGATGLPEIGLSVSGGHVYRGSAIPGLRGVYVFGDWSTAFGTPDGTLLALEETAPGSFSLSVVDLVGGNPVDFYLPAFGEDEDGEIYVATKRVAAPAGLDPATGRPTGSIFRLVSPRAPAAVALTASRDTSIFSEDGTLSSGAGNTLFAGRNAMNGLRRALLAFDLSSIPPDGFVVDASVRMVVTKTSSGPYAMGLHRVDRLWGEAGSDGGSTGQGVAAQTGDTTWTSRFFSPFNDQLWNAPGGDFAGLASALAVVDGVGAIVWSGAGLAADLQGWLDDPLVDPASNPGWILIGDEDEKSAKAFHSREGLPAGDRPTLSLTYSPAPPLSHRLQWERRYFPVGTFVEPDGDGDGDRLADLLEYAWDLDPGSSDLMNPYFSVSFDAPASALTVRFRRDPLAVDLTYALEVGSDLIDWTTITRSIGGAVASGPGFLSEETDPLDARFILVTAREILAVPPGEGRHARLRVTRP